MPRLSQCLAVAILAAIALAGGEARSASQLLGIVASNGLATPLQCQDGICSGHLSSFCLQEARPAPSADSEYEIAAGGGLTVVARLADGRELRLPGEGVVSLHTLIGFTSVRVSLSEDKLRSMGAVTASVEVGPMTTIMPMPVAGDPNPQTPEEIAYAAGPMRRLAEATFEQHGTAADAARLSSLLINVLPESEPQTAADREALWDRLAAEPGVRSMSAVGVAEAQQIYRSCELAVDSKSSFTLKSCLEFHHADLMAVSNRAFWNESGGS